MHCDNGETELYVDDICFIGIDGTSIKWADSVWPICHYSISGDMAEAVIKPNGTVDDGDKPYESVQEYLSKKSQRLTDIKENTRTEHRRLVALSQYLAEQAADSMEPDAGQPINAATRQQIADGIAAVLVAHIPPLVNIKRA